MYLFVKSFRLLFLITLVCKPWTSSARKEDGCKEHKMHLRNQFEGFLFSHPNLKEEEVEERRAKFVAQLKDDRICGRYMKPGEHRQRSHAPIAFSSEAPAKAAASPPAAAGAPGPAAAAPAAPHPTQRKALPTSDAPSASTSKLKKTVTGDKGATNAKSAIPKTSLKSKKSLAGTKAVTGGGHRTTKVNSTKSVNTTKAVTRKVKKGVTEVNITKHVTRKAATAELQPDEVYGSIATVAESDGEAWQAWLPAIGGQSTTPSLLLIWSKAPQLVLTWRDGSDSASTLQVSRLNKAAAFAQMDAESAVEAGGLHWSHPELLAETVPKATHKHEPRSDSEGEAAGVYTSEGALSSPVVYLEARSDALFLYFAEQAGPPPAGAPPAPAACAPAAECTQRVRQFISKNYGFGWERPDGPLSVLPWTGAILRNQVLRSHRKGMGWVVVHAWLEEWAPLIEWLLPFTLHADGPPLDNRTGAHSVLGWTTDRGKTWQSSSMTAPGQGLVLPSVVRLPAPAPPEEGAEPPPERLLAFFANLRGGRLHTSSSTDEGRNWTLPVASELPSTGQAVQAAVLRSGAVVVVFNNPPPERGGPGGAAARRLRSAQPSAPASAPLSIALSEDQGETWSFVRDLHPRQHHPAISMSHPTLAAAPDDSLHIVYSVHSSDGNAGPADASPSGAGLQYLRVTEEWIRKGRTAGSFQGSGP